MLHTTPQWLCSWSDRGGNGDMAMGAQQCACTAGTLPVPAGSTMRAAAACSYGAGYETCMVLLGSAAHNTLGNVAQLHHLDWVLLDITRLGLRPSPMYPGVLKLTKPLVTM